MMVKVAVNIEYIVADLATNLFNGVQTSPFADVDYALKHPYCLAHFWVAMLELSYV